MSAGVLTLNGTKQSLGLMTGVTTNGGCTRYSGRRHQAVGPRRASDRFSTARTRGTDPMQS
jgi:hypothetical protein